MNLLVTGARGGLGSDLVELSGTRWAYSSSELDITDKDAVFARVSAFAAELDNPVLINAAAYTAVDAAETDVDRAFAVNQAGPELLAAACAQHGVTLIHVSTDYVFSGDGAHPYQPSDPTGPRSVYGRSKLAGEQAVLAVGGYVVRTAWVYGSTGANFVKTMLRLESQHASLSVVDDQRGSPTWTRDLANGLLELAEAAVSRELPHHLVHCTGAGETTWCGFTKAIFGEIGADPARVNPCTTDEFPRPAPRPAYSVLSQDAWIANGLTPLRPWAEALHTAFETETFRST